MSINVYPESNGIIFNGSVVISSGSIGSGYVVDGWSGNEYTINTTLPVGTYTISPEILRARVTIGNNILTFSSSGDAPQSVYVSTALSSFKFAVNSAWSVNANQSIVLSSVPGGLVFGNGRFVASGNLTTGQVIVSTDGVNWASSATTAVIGGPNPTQQGNLLSFGNGYFLKSGGSNAISYSTDGITWTSQSTGFVTSVPTWQKVVWATNLSSYFAFGSGAYNAISTNLTTWSSRAQTATVGGQSLGVKYLNGWFLCPSQTTGIIFISTNGFTWTTRLTTITTNNPQDTTYGNGVYVVVGGRDISSSTDLTSWTARSPSGYSSTLYSVEYANGYFITVGDSGSTADASMYSSPDGTTWTSRVTFPLVTRISLKYIAYGNGVWTSFESNSPGDRLIFSSTPSGSSLGVTANTTYQLIRMDAVPLTYFA